jgi:phosphoadenosine phosphosulfate reductase
MFVSNDKIPGVSPMPDAGGPDQDLAGRLMRQYGHLDAGALLEAMIGDVFTGRIAVTTSFGTEAVVLLDQIARVDPATPVIFLDTGALFEQTLAYRESFRSRLGLTDVRTVKPDAAALASFDPGQDLWRRDGDLCCHLRKVLPLQKALAGFDAWITGRKRYQGADRAALPVIEAVNGKIKINPLAAWSQERVETAFRDRGLPRHPLSEQGYSSVGCRP